MSCAKTAEPIEMPFGLWTRVGPCTEACDRPSAHRRNLAKTIEPSMCGSDAAFLSNYFDHLLCFRHQSGSIKRHRCPSVCLSVCRSVYCRMLIENPMLEVQPTVQRGRCTHQRRKWSKCPRVRKTHVVDISRIKRDRTMVTTKPE